MRKQHLPDFARALRELREAAGLTYRQLTERAGLEYNVVWRMEIGERAPSLASALALADALGLPWTSWRAGGRARLRPNRGDWAHAGIARGVDCLSGRALRVPGVGPKDNMTGDQHGQADELKGQAGHIQAGGRGRIGDEAIRAGVDPWLLPGHVVNYPGREGHHQERGPDTEHQEGFLITAHTGSIAHARRWEKNQVGDESGAFSSGGGGCAAAT